MSLIPHSVTILCISTSLLTGAVVIPEPPDFLSAEQRAPLDAYTEALEANVAQHEEYIGSLNEKYTAALDRAREKMVKLGAARAVTALNSEIARIEAGDTKRSSEIDSAPDYVRKMRVEYDQFIARVINLKRSRDGSARFAAIDSLGSLQAELTRAEQLDNAMALRDYRKTLASPPKPPKVVNPEPEPLPDKPPGEIPPKERPPTPDLEPRAGTGGDTYSDIPRPITAADREKFAGSIPPKPARSGRGYAVMLASIQKREVTEIKLSRIKRWGSARLQMWKHKPYWTATVTYPTTSLFGTFDTEGMAIIDGNRVVEWLYTGSGEEIP